jgi:Zn-dependent M28 family amino/carboxypeptidase
MIQLLLVLALTPSCAPAQTSAPARTAGETASAGATAKKVNAEQLFADVRALADDRMEGRETGKPGGERARAYVLGRLKETGVRPLFGDSFEQPFEFRTRRGEALRGVNLVGQVRGRETPERLVVVTAHYDHVGVRNGEVYNGADDNASGVAALLAMAAHFARERPRHTVVFAALDAEEMGLRGAAALVEKLKAEKRAVALNVNMDMVGHSERGELYAAGAYHTPALRPLLERLAKDAPVKLLLGHDRPEQGQNDWTNQSDHAAFHRAGLPFVYFGVEDHKDYHKPTDDFETLTPDFFARAAETVLAAVRLFDDNLAAVGKK